MSKTFKSAASNRIMEIDGRHGNVILSIGGHSDGLGIRLDSAVIPAVMLALAEAAGFTEDDKRAEDVARSHFGDAVESLAVGIVEQEQATAEAKEQAELEAEALKLINAYRDAMGFKPCDWDAVEESDRRNWLAVARKAREMRAEK